MGNSITRVAALHTATTKAAGRIPATDVRQIMRLPSLRRLYTAIARDREAAEIVQAIAQGWASIHSKDYFEGNLHDEECPNPEAVANTVDVDDVLEDDDYGILIYLMQNHPPRKILKAYLEWANEAMNLSPVLDKLLSRYQPRAYEQGDALNDLITDTVHRINVDNHGDDATQAISEQWEQEWPDMCLQAADAAEEAADPEGYRGLSKYDF